jgi:hypothetical protein
VNCLYTRLISLVINYKSEDSHVGEDTGSLLVILPVGAAVQLDVQFLLR